MDTETLRAYDLDAAEYCAAHRSQRPSELYDLCKAFFHKGQLTADVGCGSGRDTAWLLREGFPAVGLDASPSMLREAKKWFPEIQLKEASLPNLNGVEGGAFHNVLCSATLMHVPREHLITAIFSLARILRSGGRLILSYRPSTGDGERESDGRLYTDIPSGKLTLLLEASGMQVVETLVQPDPSRPGIKWTVILAEKSPFQVTTGLERVQSVLVQDKKYATYKFALIRALCAISRNQPHIVHWGNGEVFVPMWSIAVRWLVYYWPLLTHPEFLAQRRGETPTSDKPIAFRRTIVELADSFGAGGLYALLQDLDEHPARYRRQLGRIAGTIRNGPVQYSGTNAPRLFEYIKTLPDAAGESHLKQFGWVRVPESIWLDITRFGHWIEDSVLLRWAQLSAEMNPGRAASHFLPLLFDGITDERETATVRTLLASSGQPVYCVWSGADLRGRYEVDHVIPYAVWGNNSLWNLLPAMPKLNNQKRDKLPTRRLLLGRKEGIVHYWRLYRQAMPASFERQVSRALGMVVGESNWEAIAFAGLQETVERVAVTRGLARWEP